MKGKGDVFENQTGCSRIHEMLSDGSFVVSVFRHFGIAPVLYGLRAGRADLPVMRFYGGGDDCFGGLGVDRSGADFSGNLHNAGRKNVEMKSG